MNIQALWDKWGEKISKSDMETLEKGFSQLCDREVQLEEDLRVLKEVKARFLWEIGKRIEHRDK